MFESNEPVKVAAIEVSNANLDAFKILKGKRKIQDGIAIKDPNRTTCADDALEMMFIH